MAPKYDPKDKFSQPLSAIALVRHEGPPIDTSTLSDETAKRILYEVIDGRAPARQDDATEAVWRLKMAEDVSDIRRLGLIVQVPE